MYLQLYIKNQGSTGQKEKESRLILIIQDFWVKITIVPSLQYVGELKNELGRSFEEGFKHSGGLCLFFTCENYFTVLGCPCVHREETKRESEVPAMTATLLKSTI